MQKIENLPLIVAGFLVILWFCLGWQGLHALYYRWTGEQQTIVEMVDLQQENQQELIDRFF